MSPVSLITEISSLSFSPIIAIIAINRKELLSVDHNPGLPAGNDGKSLRIVHIVVTGQRMICIVLDSRSKGAFSPF